MNHDTCVEDNSSWFLENPIADFLLMRTVEVHFMLMICFTFYQGSEVFKTFSNNVSTSYKFFSLLLSCTGGGILVPIFINGGSAFIPYWLLLIKPSAYISLFNIFHCFSLGIVEIPFPLANDMLMIAVIFSFALHIWCPFLREVLELSPIMKIIMVIFHETVRTSVVVKFTLIAAASITPSLFSYPVAGPILCGTVAGVGGVFLPLDKGLNPIKNDGMRLSMIMAFFGSLCLNLFLNTGLSNGVIHAKEKAHILMIFCFIISGFFRAFPLAFSRIFARNNGSNCKKVSNLWCWNYQPEIFTIPFV